MGGGQAPSPPAIRRIAQSGLAPFHGCPFPYRVQASDDGAFRAFRTPLQHRLPCRQSASCRQDAQRTAKDQEASRALPRARRLAAHPGPPRNLATRHKARGSPLPTHTVSRLLLVPHRPASLRNGRSEDERHQTDRRPVLAQCDRQRQHRRPGPAARRCHQGAQGISRIHRPPRLAAIRSLRTTPHGHLRQRPARDRPGHPPDPKGTIRLRGGRLPRRLSPGEAPPRQRTLDAPHRRFPSRGNPTYPRRLRCPTTRLRADHRDLHSLRRPEASRIRPGSPPASSKQELNTAAQYYGFKKSSPTLLAVVSDRPKPVHRVSLKRPDAQLRLFRVSLLRSSRSWSRAVGQFLPYAPSAERSFEWPLYSATCPTGYASNSGTAAAGITGDERPE